MELTPVGIVNKIIGIVLSRPLIADVKAELSSVFLTDISKFTKQDFYIDDILNILLIFKNYEHQKKYQEIMNLLDIESQLFVLMKDIATVCDECHKTNIVIPSNTIPDEAQIVGCAPSMSTQKDITYPIDLISSLLTNNYKFHDQLKVYFNALVPWEKGLIEQSFRFYWDCSESVEYKLSERGIEYTVFPRSIFDTLISLQSDKQSKDPFFYLSGVNESTIYVPFDVFGSLRDITDNKFRLEVAELIAMNKFWPRYKWDSYIENVHAKNKKILLAKLMPYVHKFFKKSSFEIWDLLPEKRNISGSHTDRGGIAIPVEVSWIDETKIERIFNLLSFYTEMNLIEQDKFVKNLMPKWFDIWYLCSWSWIEMVRGAKKPQIAVSNCSNIWYSCPVILYRNIVILPHDASQLKWDKDDSIFTNISQSEPVVDMLNKSVENMLKANINPYKIIIDNTPAHIRNLKKNEHKTPN